MKKIIFFLLILMIGLTSCILMPVEEELPETSTQAGVFEVEDSIDEIDALEKELDLSELDEIERDLAELDW